MAFVKDFLSPDERAEVAHLLETGKGEPSVLEEALSELLLARKAVVAMRRSRYLMANREVRTILDAMPGSRAIPRANLHPRKR